MNSSSSFSKGLKQFIPSKQQPFSPDRFSFDSQYCTEGASRNLNQDSDLQSYLPQTNSYCQIPSLSRTPNPETQKQKKTVKTIKLKTGIKPESNQNEVGSFKQSKIKQRLNTQNNCQSSQNLFKRFRLAESCHNNALYQSSHSNSKNPQNSKSNLLSNGVTPNMTPNKHSAYSSYNVTCRQSQILSLSPIKDKVKLEVRLKKVESLYQNSIKNYKQLLLKLEIEIQKGRLADKQKQRMRECKQSQDLLLKQKEQTIKGMQQIIRQRQKQILESQKRVKEKQLIINQKNEEFNSIISEYQFRTIKYQESIARYEQQLSRTKNELCLLNVKIEPFNSKMISCLDQIEYLKQQKEEMAKTHIQELYFKNKEILRLNMIVQNSGNTESGETLSFDTFGGGYNYQEPEQYYQHLDEKVSIIVNSKHCLKTLNDQINEQDKVNGGSCKDGDGPIVKKNSLMDMKEVMSVDGAEETHRSSY